MNNLTFKHYQLVADKYRKDFSFFKKVVFPVLMHWEGGGKLHNVKGDLGGWTIWGIAWNIHAKKFDHDFEFFKKLTKHQACVFAFTNYYIGSKANLVPLKCRLFYIDMAYNMGVKRAVIILQKCIGGIRVDGVFGKITASKVSCVNLKCLHKLRNKRYQYLTVIRPVNIKFLKGWLRRSNAVYKKIY